MVMTTAFGQGPPYFTATSVTPDDSPAAAHHRVGRRWQHHALLDHQPDGIAVNLATRIDHSLNRDGALTRMGRHRAGSAAATTTCYDESTAEPGLLTIYFNTTDAQHPPLFWFGNVAARGTWIHQLGADLAATSQTVSNGTLPIMKLVAYWPVRSRLRILSTPHKSASTRNKRQERRLSCPGSGVPSAVATLRGRSISPICARWPRGAYRTSSSSTSRAARRMRPPCAATAASLEPLRLLPHTLVDTSSRHLRTEILGARAAAPLIIGPTGLNGMLHADGDIGLARAAAHLGIPFTLSTISTTRLEDVAKQAGGRLWMQLYVMKKRARCAGHHAPRGGRRL